MSVQKKVWKWLIILTIRRSGHKDLLKNIATDTLIIAEKSDHMVIFDQPELIVSEIAKMVAKVRGHR